MFRKEAEFPDKTRGSCREEDSELRAILKLLQASGLAPYFMGKDRQRTRISYVLVAYHLFLAAGILGNMILAEKDDRNNADYPNKSFLIRIAFDVVDVLENIHPCFVIVRCLLFTNVSIGIWFKIKLVNKKLRDLNVEFDDEKFAKFVYGEAVAFVFLSAAFLGLDILLCGRLGIYYTYNYWLLCGLPLVQNSITEVTYGGLVLILYQRFWVVNEFLVHYVRRNEEKKTRRKTSPSTDRTLENIMMGGKSEKKIHLPPVWYSRKVRPAKKKVPEKLPLLVTMKNYGECFGNKFKVGDRDVDFIRSLKILHFELFDVSNDLNSIFGWNLLFIFAVSFFGCTINLYFVIIFHLKSYDIEQYFSCLTWMAVYLFKVLYFIACTCKSSQEAHRTSDLIHLILNKTDVADTQLQVELKAFCLQLSQCRVQFTAAGFFTVDHAFLFQFVAGVLSNVVFVVQFDKINFSDE